MSKLQTLQDIVYSADRNTMASGKGRKALAHRLEEGLGYWGPPLHSFVEEMRGLNFRNAEDRETFILFFQRAYTL
jgi:hypothetical protein